jgi:hypothetical protein
MDSGLLHIDLARPQPEARVKTIRITTAGNGAAKSPTLVESKPEPAD